MANGHGPGRDDAQDGRKRPPGERLAAIPEQFRTRAPVLGLRSDREHEIKDVLLPGEDATRERYAYENRRKDEVVSKPLHLWIASAKCWRKKHFPRDSDPPSSSPSIGRRSVTACSATKR